MHNRDPLFSNSTRRGFLKAAGAAGLSSILLSDRDLGEQSVSAGAETTDGPDALDRKNEFSTEPSWQQDFSTMPDGPVDDRVWRFELDPEVPTYNEEAQAYTSSERNVRIENGRLVLEAHREPYVYQSDPNNHQYEITSGRIDTKDSFNFEYGKFEATMKLPGDAGTWPAFWFLSANQPNTAKLRPTDEDWEKERFYLHDGELDAMEAYGADPGVIEGTVHTYVKSESVTVAMPDASKSFHTYGIELTPDKIVWTLDSLPYGSFDKPSDDPDEWPFGGGNQLYLIFNLAMGSAGGGIDSFMKKWRLEISDVSFYSYSPAE